MAKTTERFTHLETAMGLAGFAVLGWLLGEIIVSFR